MSPEVLMMLPVVLPLAAAVFVLPFLRRSPKACAGLVLLSVVLSGIAFWVASGAEPRLVRPWVEAFTLSFSLSGWKTFLLGFMFLFQLMTAAYSLGAAQRIAKPYLYILALLIAFASSALVILTDNLLILLVGWEVFLVGLYAMIHSGGEAAEPAARKALIIGGAGDFLMILGLMLFFSMAPADPMAARIPIASNPTAFWAFFLIFLGAGAKAGMFPFHTWIPDAAQVMPAPGFAAMPASLEKVLGIYLLFVLTHQMFLLDARSRIIMYAFGLVTVFVSIVPALIEKDLRKVLALTAISPVGFMVCGMASSEAAGLAGALVYMLTHATYKSAMFLSLGNLEEKTGSSALDRLTGIARTMPLSGSAFLMAAVAAVSLPPTGGFMAKELIFEGILEHGHLPALVLLIVGAILNVAVFSKVIAVLWAAAPGQSNEAASIQSLPALLLGVAALCGGFIFQHSAALILGVAGAHDPAAMSNIWHFSALSVVSLSIYSMGFLFYAGARSRATSAAEAFTGLRTSAVFGPALLMAEQKKFDGYELGVKAVDFMSRIVFQYVERMIDVVADGVIGSGRRLSRPILRGAHNGVYGNYLSWALLGFVLVLLLFFGSAIEG